MLGYMPSGMRSAFAPHEKKNKREKKDRDTVSREAKDEKKDQRKLRKRMPSSTSLTESSSSSCSRRRRRRKKAKGRNKRAKSGSASSHSEERRRAAAAVAAATGALNSRARDKNKRDPCTVKTANAYDSRGDNGSGDSSKPAMTAPGPQDRPDVMRGVRVSDSRNPDHIDVLELPRHLIGRIIGKAGATIKSIRERSGARIDARDQTEDPVRVLISGTKDAVELAKSMLLDVAEGAAIAAGADGLASEKDVLNQNRDSNVGGEAPVASAGNDKPQPVDVSKKIGRAHV